MKNPAERVPPILRPDRLPALPACTALVLDCPALTRSLLQRGPLFQRLLCAVAGLLRYALGAAANWVLRGAGIPLIPSRSVARVLLAVAVLGSAGMLWLAHHWQQEQRRLIGMDPAPAVDPLLALLVAVAAFAVLIVVARAVRGLGRWLGGVIGRVFPLRIAVVIGMVAAIWATAAFVHGVAIGRVGASLDASFLAVNDEFSTDVPAPSLAEVSGGPGSAVAWQDLGRQGRIFIANTPTREQIAGFFAEGGGSEAADAVRQPIRVYVGSDPDDADLRARADAAVDELERTGAFDRAVINVATGTGRGWVNENQARALEYLRHGDTATVSIQYSHLPSWMSYLVDGDRPRQAGQALFEAVYARWTELPPDRRPKLVVSGESLGSFGSEGAFSGAQDLAARTDGALWVGPTASNALWQRLVHDREPGSPVYLPVADGGETVRFSADGRAWAGPAGGVAPWAGPRVGYLQHANDPVTWLDAASVFSAPELLTGARGPGIPDQMIWIPVVTALQLAVDQLASGVPDGQGHEFGQAPAYAWAAILPPPGWAASDTVRLAAELTELRLTDLDSSSS